MNRDLGDGDSFDPRSWGGRDAGNDGVAPSESAVPPAPPSTPATAQRSGPRQPAGPPGSFDPRTWAAGDAPAGNAAPPPPAPPTAAPAVASRTDRSGFAAAVSSLAIILVGAGIAWSQHAAPPPAALAAATPTAAGGDGVAAAAPPPVPVTNASRRSLTIAGPDDIGPTLAASGVPADQVRAAVGAAAFGLGKEPGEIHLEYDLADVGGAQKLTRLLATRNDGAGVTLTAKPDGSYGSEVLQAKLATTVKVVRGEMDGNSFYSSAVAAGVDDSLIDAFANAFSYDFNFATDLKAGDVFEAAFEQKVNPRGDRVGLPRLIYVSISTAAKSKSLYSFLAPGDTEAGWYDGNGRSTIRALMRTPVDGARISSGFGMRFHPVLHFNKLHKGTDFAAPIGTPIYAAGTGVILWAAMKGPNGNLTILQHDNGWQTYYLHQSMFMPGVVAGARVNQGQKIGEIGTTGRSTGPHLHFELHVNNEPVDPMSIDTGTGKVLADSGLAAFKKERDRIDAARASAAN